MGECAGIAPRLFLFIHQSVCITRGMCVDKKVAIKTKMDVQKKNENRKKRKNNLIVGTACVNGRSEAFFEC